MADSGIELDLRSKADTRAAAKHRCEVNRQSAPNRTLGQRDHISGVFRHSTRGLVLDVQGKVRRSACGMVLEDVQGKVRE